MKSVPRHFRAGTEKNLRPMLGPPFLPCASLAASENFPNAAAAIA